MELYLESLWVYPVKGARGISVEDWGVGPLGLEWDRRWMLVGPSGEFASQRTVPSLSLLRVQIQLPAPGDPAGRMVLSFPNLGSIELPLRPKEGDRMAVEVWGDSVQALAPSPEADRWCSRALDSPCRLVFLPEEQARAVDPGYAPGHRVSFADGFPILLTTGSSLTDLQRRLPPEVSLGMDRFRPNVVVGGPAVPHAEDGWSEVRCGDVTLLLVKPCARCSVPTVDPERGVFAGPEPLRTLATYRRKGNEVFFGQNGVVQGEGRLRVGSPVDVIFPAD